MYKKFIISIFNLILILNLNGQLIEKYKWEENPVCTAISNDDKNETAICLYLFERDEFFYDETGIPCTYNIFHKKIKIIDDEQVNSFNKIYISLASVIEITEIKARSVNPDGTVVDFDKSNIKEIKDEEGSEGYKIFAIEGIQKGADVEFFYERKMYADFNGRSYFQFKYPVKKARFELACPANMFFDFKIYNSKIEITKQDSTDKEYRLYYADFENINGLNVPRYAYYNPLRLRVEYRLEKNLNKDFSPVYTWDEAAKRVYNMTYVLSQTEQKALKKFVKKSLDVSDQNNEEKIKIVEKYLKTNILIQDYSSQEFSQLDFIIKNKIANERGILKLMANIFKGLGINHQIVLTADRSNIKFDGDFQSWNYLESYLIYFPDLDKFLAPADIELRVGYVPDLLTATDGLFIETVKVWETESAIGHIKYIPPLSFEKNFSNMLIEIDIDMENEKAVVKTEMSLHGLSGGYLSEIYKLVEENRKEEFLKSMMKNPVGSNKFLKIELRDKSLLQANDTIEGSFFIVYAEYESASLLERAGDKYILNIGETIGEQVEMYQEDERLTDVENEFNHWYYREIILNVPDGYQIKNPDAANMNIVSDQDGRKVYGFESSYHLHDFLYKVAINEYYKKIFTDKSLADEFTKVVNAAADFNKVALILEKK